MSFFSVDDLKLALLSLREKCLLFLDTFFNVVVVVVVVVFVASPHHKEGGK